MPSWYFNMDPLATQKASHFMYAITGPNQPCRMSGQLSPAHQQEAYKPSSLLLLRIAGDWLFKSAFSCCA